jgi:hypothetical protein
VRGRGAQSLSCASCGSARPLNGDRLLGSLIELPPAAAQAPVMLLIGAAYILVAACATTRPPAVADQCDADPSKGWMQLSAPPPGADRFLNDLPERGKSVAAQLGPIRTVEKRSGSPGITAAFASVVTRRTQIRAKAGRKPSISWHPMRPGALRALWRRYVSMLSDALSDCTKGRWFLWQSWVSTTTT